ncbi:uncharacterized protein BP5553_02782 [Venustampulla echinocandica]|uniref:AAA+ ATPase domain-containing protein n=1 Tax=Venustampulla echinocandica TaxID=2656787 RepID=A0A370TSD3_9HELO|nr:uncharacterized protein BP5553_02782 [Venustampulla echinocandica]RDL38442.1 hypothetical protein BP5553_02782 [Venustampulla echinocandica]
MDSDSDDYSSSQGDDVDPFAFVGAEIDDSVDPPGLKCELTTYDARYNAKGERIRLAAGKKKQVVANRPRDHDSALALTRYYDHDKVLDYTSLEIRSPHVKAALRKVIPLYPGVNLHANKVTIRGIPKCLFHYRQELGMYGGTLKDQEAVKHLIFALRYMYDALRDEVSSYYNLMESPNIEPGLPFLNLWMAFRPGDHIYLKSNGVDRVYRFLFMDRCECFNPHCRKSRWALSLEEIDYDGSDFGHTKVTSYIDPYQGHIPLKHLRAFPLQYHPNKHEITAAMIARGRKFIALRGVHYLGYDGVAEALSHTRNKTFLGEDDEFPFQSVPDQKDMILSLVNIHSDQRVAFDDVIKGKGKGMIFLLHGVPGVGKTLTAESVADYTKRPLYTVSCGELGVGTDCVENNLSSALELATKWNAIALIDEADVFLEQRSAHDLERNSLVSSKCFLPTNATERAMESEDLRTLGDHRAKRRRLD